MKLAMIFICAAAAWAQTSASQSVERVFYFIQTPAQGFTDGITALRTVADVQKATFDNAAHSLTVTAPADKMPLVDWLFHELDQSPAPVPATVTHEYPLPVQTPLGPEVAKVFYLAHADTQQAVTDTVTAMRTVADVIRLFPFTPLRAIVARSTAERMAAGEWLIREFDRHAGNVQAVHEYGLPLVLSSRETDVVKVFNLAHADTPQQVNEMVTVIRTVASVNRVFPFNSFGSLALAGSPDSMAIAEWLFHEMDQQPAASFTANTFRVPAHPPYRPDDVVIVFHLAQDATLESIEEVETAIRAMTGMQRMFHCSSSKTVAVFGTASAVEQAKRLVKQKDRLAAQ
jgi:hypothetical protein